MVKPIHRIYVYVFMVCAEWECVYMCIGICVHVCMCMFIKIGAICAWCLHNHAVINV